MTYSERLRVPTSWWAIAMFFALTFATAVGFYAGPEVAIGAGLATAVAVAAVLLWFGRARVQVDAGGVRVGGAWLEWPYLGEVTVLDRAATRFRLGPGADPAAWLLVRGYLPASIELAITDPGDPHPYWLVSSRDPALMAQVIEQCRAISPSVG